KKIKVHSKSSIADPDPELFFSSPKASLKSVNKCFTCKDFSWPLNIHPAHLQTYSAITINLHKFNA
ncbi:MAG: hypothetical protein ACK53Y_00710, partial [bacterium]